MGARIAGQTVSELGAPFHASPQPSPSVIKHVNSSRRKCQVPLMTFTHRGFDVLSLYICLISLGTGVTPWSLEMVTGISTLEVDGALSRMKKREVCGLILR